MDPTWTRAIERLIVASLSPMLVYIGYNLFLAGAEGKMQLSASIGSGETADRRPLDPVR